MATVMTINMAMVMVMVVGVVMVDDADDGDVVC